MPARALVPGQDLAEVLAAGSLPAERVYPLLIQLVQWVLGTALQLGYAARSGALLPTLVSSLFSLITAALLVRVISSWFGASPYSWWMRIVRGLTDWILEPLQRILPPMGPMDFSPLVAYFLLRVAQQVVVGALFRS